MLIKFYQAHIILSTVLLFIHYIYIEAIYTIVRVLGFEVKATQYRIIKLSETGRFGPCGPFINCI